jgi:hypothetical protein
MSGLSALLGVAMEMTWPKKKETDIKFRQLKKNNEICIAQIFSVFLFGVQDEIGRMETVQNGRVLSA